MAEKIALHLSDHKYRKTENFKEGYMILKENHVEYKMVADFYKLDEDGLPEFQTSNYRWVRSRKAIFGVEMYYENKLEIWAVEMTFVGSTESAYCSFQTPKEALALYNKLHDYFINTPQ